MVLWESSSSFLLLRADGGSNGRLGHWGTVRKRKRGFGREGVLMGLGVSWAVPGWGESGVAGVPKRGRPGSAP